MQVNEDKIPAEVIRNLEQVEVEAFGDLYRGTPRGTASSIGMKLYTTPTTCTTIMAKIDTLAFNRVIGLGLSEPVTAERLDEITGHYREHKVPRFFIQLHPDAVTQRTAGLLAAKGLRHYNNWVKLYRPVEPIAEVKTDLRIEKIGREHADKFAEIMVTSFEWNETLRPMVAASVGRPGWHHYMAFDADIPVATAAFFAAGEYAWIDMAATLHDYRGRGAQGALVERRIADMAAMGCRWIVVETAEQTPNKEAPSYRNMIRYGFKTAYVRPNYIYEF
jgi:GNAT superfamily N-acetyltransferase